MLCLNKIKWNEINSCKQVQRKNINFKVYIQYVYKYNWISDEYTLLNIINIDVYKMNIC